ncbi:MAG: hypothetical protein VST72_08740 [Nitrospirota bacterium]|nr:hypothetical protein [Nitrospirota bacterium]
MSIKEKLLFVTKGVEDYEEGFSYVVELARILRTNIFMLMIYDKPLIKTFEDSMAAVAFAEADETKTAREFSEERLRKIQADTKVRTDALIEKYCINGGPLKIRYKAVVGDIVSNIKKIADSEPAIDMVLLSPNLSNKGGISIRKLLKNISRPIVTMSKPANAKS